MQRTHCGNSDTTQGAVNRRPIKKGESFRLEQEARNFKPTQHNFRPVAPRFASRGRGNSRWQQRIWTREGEQAQSGQLLLPEQRSKSESPMKHESSLYQDISSFELQPSSIHQPSMVEETMCLISALSLNSESQSSSSNLDTDAQSFNSESSLNREWSLCPDALPCNPQAFLNQASSEVVPLSIPEMCLNPVSSSNPNTILPPTISQKSFSNTDALSFVSQSSFNSNASYVNPQPVLNFKNPCFSPEVNFNSSMPMTLMPPSMEANRPEEYTEYSQTVMQMPSQTGAQLSLEAGSINAVDPFSLDAVFCYLCPWCNGKGTIYVRT